MVYDYIRKIHKKVSSFFHLFLKGFFFFKEQNDLIFSQAFDGQSGLVKAGSFYHLKEDDGIKE